MLYRNKKQNDINAGKWIGVGGHIKKGESPEDALKREVYEETGCILRSYTKRGIVDFYYNDAYSEKIYIYVSDDYIGRVKPCDEGDLSWVNKEDVLKLNLWEGDRIFLDILLKEAVYFELELYYEADKLIRSVRVR